MGVPMNEALSNLEQAAKELYRSDPRVHAVGIAGHDGGFGFRVVRNTRRLVASGLAVSSPASYQNIPVAYINASNDPRSLFKKISAGGPASSLDSTLVGEQELSRPLVCGLQIQNIDDDLRLNRPQLGFIVIGTLGCFVRVIGDSGNSFILSNNHVVAGENRGINGQDRIQQQGGPAFDPNQFVATLQDFVQLQFSAPGATFTAGTATLNDVDAGIAKLEGSVGGSNTFLAARGGLPLPTSTAQAQPGDSVFKVGRTTGLTHGTITQVSTIVGPVDYDGQPAWFRNSIEIEGVGGTTFSDRGDSGSAIIKDTGEIVGLLYAGNGQQTYACPIDPVFGALNISL